MGWSAGKLWPKRSGSWEKAARVPAKAASARMDLQKGQNIKLLQKPQGTSWAEGGEDPGFVFF